MEEIFCARDIFYPNDKGHGLVHLDLSLKRGEILGIYGNRYSGKNKLFGVIQGNLIPTAGHVYWNGKTSGKEVRVSRVGSDTKLIKEMTIWENLAILCWKGRENLLLQIPKLKKMTELVLEDYGLQISPGKKVEKLSPMEILCLEIVTARLQKAQILLIDNEGIEAAPGEYELLKALLLRMRNEKMAICYFGYQIPGLYFLCEKIAVLSEGRILKILYRRDWAEDEMEKLIAGLSSGYDRVETLNPEQEEQVLCVRKLQLEKNRLINLTLYSGEYVVLLCRTADMFARMRAEISGEEVFFLDTQFIDKVIEEFSPMENLCLGFSHRFSKCGFEKKSVVECIRKEFESWYGSADFLKQKDSRGLYRKERIAINLYRIMLKNPGVLICNDLNIRNDLSTYQLLRDSLIRLARNGKAICIITNEPGYTDDAVTRYILEDEMY